MVLGVAGVCSLTAPSRAGCWRELVWLTEHCKTLSNSKTTIRYLIAAIKILRDGVEQKENPFLETSSFFGGYIISALVKACFSVAIQTNKRGPLVDMCAAAAAAPAAEDKVTECYCQHDGQKINLLKQVHSNHYNWKWADLSACVHTQLLIEGIRNSVLGGKVSSTHRVCQEIDAVFGRDQTLDTKCTVQSFKQFIFIWKFQDDVVFFPI